MAAQRQIHSVEAGVRTMRKIKKEKKVTTEDQRERMRKRTRKRTKAGKRGD